LCEEKSQRILTFHKPDDPLEIEKLSLRTLIFKKYKISYEIFWALWHKNVTNYYEKYVTFVEMLLSLLSFRIASYAIKLLLLLTFSYIVLW